MLTLFLASHVPIKVGEKYLLSGDEGHHAARVLRTEIGDQLLLSDGKGSWSRVRVLSVGKSSLDLEVMESGFQEALGINFTVIQALPKGDRSKEAIELLTEAGADRIIPWNSARTIGKGSVEKLQVTARETSKQARRFWVPEVHEIATSAQILEIVREADLAIAFHESATKKLSELIIDKKAISSVVLVIGPEGGLSDEEINALSQAGAEVCLLGRPVLRSAHAGIAAISALNVLLGLW